MTKYQVPGYTAHESIAILTIKCIWNILNRLDRRQVPNHVFYPCGQTAQSCLTTRTPISRYDCLPAISDSHDESPFAVVDLCPKHHVNLEGMDLFTIMVAYEIAEVICSSMSVCHVSASLKLYVKFTRVGDGIVYSLASSLLSDLDSVVFTFISCMRRLCR